MLSVVKAYHLTHGCSSLRMGRKLLETSSWWLIGLILVFSLTESRFLPGGINSHTPSRTKIQPKVLLVKRQQSAELSARPRPIVVSCHPDSMEVVVQADMFNTGLQVDATYLHLGSDAVGEGSACSASASGEAQFTIKAQLMDCGTKLSVCVVIMGCSSSFIVEIRRYCFSWLGSFTP